MSRSTRASLMGVALIALGWVGLQTVEANGPAERQLIPLGGEVFECPDQNYELTGGELFIVMHEGESQGGPVNFTLTSSPRRATAEGSEDGETYSIQGAFWTGGMFNPETGVQAMTLTDKFQIVKKGEGTVASVNAVFHISPGTSFGFEFGECTSPDD